MGDRLNAHDGVHLSTCRPGEGRNAEGVRAAVAGVDQQTDDARIVEQPTKVVVAATQLCRAAVQDRGLQSRRRLGRHSLEGRQRAEELAVADRGRHVVVQRRRMSPLAEAAPPVRVARPRRLPIDKGRVAVLVNGWQRCDSLRRLLGCLLLAGATR